MKTAAPIDTDIVLLGGGHAHVAVLKSFAMKPVPGVRLTLITRDVFTPYSGMLPGYLAGHYDHEECHVDLGPLCRFAGARLIHSAASGLDLAGQQVLLPERPALPYDLLSIDVGSSPKASEIPGAGDFALPVKPVDVFVARWAAAEERLMARGGPARIAVIGAGAGGVELALSLKHRLRDRLELALTVITDQAEALTAHAPAVRRRMVAALAARGIALITNAPVTEIGEGRLLCGEGREVEFDEVLLLTHAAPQPWLEQSGLAADQQGFVAVDETLNSTSHANVFAAGDIAAFVARGLPKSGVYAVRQGPALAENLRRAARRRTLKPYRPQTRTLALISTGNKNAVASYGALALEGRWIWRLKDWIDRRWMAKYQDLPQMDEGAGEGEHALMRCGGCGAKVADVVLRRALAELPSHNGAGVVLGLDAPDDAAAIEVPAGLLLVQTVDNFRPFIDDPYLFGRITANHCLNDLYAMGATPHSALANVVLPYGPEDKLEQDLRALLTGASETLAAAGIDLIGGHTGEGAELSFGLTVNGTVARDEMTRKGGLAPGDALIVTKPLGTGVIFAADMKAEARSQWVSGALATMLQVNDTAAQILRRHGVHAVTDISGFGLLGHLSEMLKASGGCGAALALADLPLLAGAEELAARGIESTMRAANDAFAVHLDGPKGNGQARAALLFDPQTAGGLLAGVPADQAARCLASLRDAGYDAARIGAVEAASGVRFTEEFDAD